MLVPNRVKRIVIFLIVFFRSEIKSVLKIKCLSYDTTAYKIENILGCGERHKYFLVFSVLVLSACRLVTYFFIYIFWVQKLDWELGSMQSAHELFTLEPLQWRDGSDGTISSGWMFKIDFLFIYFISVVLCSLLFCSLVHVSIADELRS